MVFIAKPLFSQIETVRELSYISDSLQQKMSPSAYVAGKIRLDSVFVHDTDLILYFNNALSEYPFREQNVKEIYEKVGNLLPDKFKSLNLRIVSNRLAIEEFIIPAHKITTRRRPVRVKENSLITKVSRPYIIPEGLTNRHLAVWQSHGYYYEQKLLRWEWQRARIFQTVEDLYTQSYVVPFLVPMLENAGANVFLPRERDPQINEIIVDNNIPGSGYSEHNGSHMWEQSAYAGFSNPKPLYISGENPFLMGTARVINSIRRGNESFAQWQPDIPEYGEYAVYVSYQSLPNSTSDALYKVKHSGGTTEFRINQKMGGGTWIYLGTFVFNEINKPHYVRLSNLTGKNGEVVTADGVKFGGGMGNIAREPYGPIDGLSPDVEFTPEISNYPRFTEASRYWLQWAGFSDTIYSPNQNRNDYNDDFMSRGRWVNIMSGGSEKNKNENGYGIPLDMALSFHTDAGTTLNDSIIGTLGIYTRFSDGNAYFPDGTPRFISRYLTDIIQTQIVDDIKYLYEPIWQRRGIWDRSYSESRTPKVPTMLLELLSHQNFADMRYGLDPHFRFDVSRAIYKGILKFLAIQSGTHYTVQPLPVTALSAVTKGDKVQLNWKPVEDPLEPSAKAERYIVYTRINGGGFDNGIVVNSNSYESEISRGNIYSYKISALNKGGESFPSEILSVYLAPEEKGKILIINAFNRISAPSSFAASDTSYAGFFDYCDNGVAYINDYSYTGSQYEFRREIPWMDDDSPGFGSSYADFETKVIAGNTFDYPIVYGEAFKNLGYSFESVSSASLDYYPAERNEYSAVIVILGKQKQTKIGRGVSGIKYHIFSQSLMNFLDKYALSGGNILVSGAYVASDLWDSFENDSTKQIFAQEVLKYTWRTNNASKNGEVKAVVNPFRIAGNYIFNTLPNSNTYSVESPDGIEPYGSNSWTILRYSDNNISAGIAHKGDYKTVILGFPIETLTSQEQINQIIKSIIDFFEK